MHFSMLQTVEKFVDFCVVRSRDIKFHVFNYKRLRYYPAFGIISYCCMVGIKYVFFFGRHTDVFQLFTRWAEVSSSYSFFFSSGCIYAYKFVWSSSVSTYYVSLFQA